VRTPRRVVLLSSLCCVPFTVRAQTAQVEALMRAMRAVPERLDAFTEERAIPELDLPLPSSGVLRWRAPDRLEKHTTSPIDERLVVEGDRLLYERADRGVRREFGLDDQPEMRALVEAVRATLAGDLPALSRHYEVAFDGSPTGDWRLALTPVSVRVRAAVQRILVSGRGAQVLAVDTEGGGGVTRMRIQPRP
jgi:Outer membrane lipoprotein carrier protein LolA-like